MKKCLNPSYPISPEVGELSKKWRPIKLKKNKPKDLAALIFHMVVERESTVTVRSEVTQCTPSRHRSAEDIFKAAKFYKKDITLEQVVEGIKKLYSSNRIYNNYCTTVSKYVHHTRSLTTKVEDLRNSMGETNIEF